MIKIVSGGQTGADRGALEAAVELGFHYGGWIPSGRKAEDGEVPKEFDKLKVHYSSGYAGRTKANVQISDWTVVFADLPPSGGSRLTLSYCHELGKPFLLLDAQDAIEDPEGEARSLISWLDGKVGTLNVAGSRESKAPGLQAAVKEIISLLLQSVPEGEIYTVGQGKLGLMDLLDVLGPRGVHYLIDVRSSPFSKYAPQFSSQSLSRFLKANGLGYVFMGDLLGGKPTDQSLLTNGKPDYGKIRAGKKFKEGISRLIDARRKGFSVCLFCAEGDPARCHRAKLIGVELAKADVDVVHLLGDGRSAPQREVVPAEQMPLFGDP